MSTRLRSSKRTRQSASTESTPSTRERGKRERRKATTTAAATTTPPSTATTSLAVDGATDSSSAQRSVGRLLENEVVERIDIKVEPLDLTSDGEAEAIDVKPDVHQLQQALLLQHQQLQQQTSQHEVLPAAALLSSAAAAAAASLPPSVGGAAGGGKRVYIIGDLATLTSLANSGNNAALSCLAASAAGGTDGIGGVGPDCGSAAMSTTSNAHATCDATIATALSTAKALAATPTSSSTTTAMTMMMTAAAATATATPTVKAKTLVDAFVKDEFDLQQSDADEDGYSDIDFDEDDDFVEVDNEFDMYDPQWTDLPTAARLVFPFEWPPNDLGLEGRPKSANPLFYFNKLLGDFGVFFGLLATGTNERVHQMFDVEAADTEACIKEEITADDIRCFVGLCLQMSTLQLPTLADYWNEQSHCGFVGFGSLMSLKRFQLILHALNFEHIGQGNSSSGNIGGHDPLAEIQPLVEFFNQRMADIYLCGQRLVLNEPIVYWQGKCHWHRSMSERFRANAVTLHTLTEYTGFVLRIVPDVEAIGRKQLVRNSKFLAQHRVALAKELLQDKFGQGFTVYASKYYGSCGLAYELANQRTYCTGMLDNKRYGNCKQLVLTPLKECAFAVKYASPLMMGKWRRREKCVYFYSSDCLAIYVNETAWRSKDRRPKIIKELEWQLQLPENIRRDMVHYQPALERKDMKWHRHLAIYILNLMVMNSYILYTMYAPIGRSHVIELHLKDTSKLKSYAEFRQFVIGSLLGTVKEDEADETTSPSKQKRHNKRKRSLGNNTDDDDEEKSGGSVGTERAAAKAQAAAAAAEVKHTLKEVPRRNGKTLKRKCRICRKGGMLTLTKFCCDVCPGTPGLCETPCFEIWHAQLKQSLKDGMRIKVAWQ